MGWQKKKKGSDHKGGDISTPPMEVDKNKNKKITQQKESTNGQKETATEKIATDPKWVQKQLGFKKKKRKNTKQIQSEKIGKVSEKKIPSPWYLK